MSARGRLMAAGLAVAMLAAHGVQTGAVAQRRDGVRNNNVNRQNFQSNNFRKDVTVNRNVNVSGNNVDVNRGPSWGGAAAGVAVGVAVGAAAASAAKAPAYPPPPPYPYYPYYYPPPY